MRPSLKLTSVDRLRKIDVDAIVEGSVAKAVAAAVMSAGTSARPRVIPANKTDGVALSSLNSAQRQILEAAASMPRPNAKTRMPSRAEIELCTQKNATGAESIVGVMRAQRLIASGKI
jgi:hypothetical protein